jgi:hypothetical protein
VEHVLMTCSPYGKLVQKGHARMFYNVSDEQPHRTTIATMIDSIPR